MMKSSNSRTWKRFRSIIVTMFLIIGANIAISYAAGVTILPDAPRPKAGVTILPDAPRPKAGVTILPDAPRPKAGVTILPDAPRP